MVIAYFGMTADGNWHESPVAGGNVLAVAEGQQFDAEIAAALEKMRHVRARRVRPGLDDKILTSWNGLMLSALAVCGRVLEEKRYVEAAEKLARFLLSRHLRPVGLLRVSRGGAAHTPGFLDDYAFLLNGLLDSRRIGSRWRMPGNSWVLQCKSTALFERTSARTRVGDFSLRVRGMNSYLPE